MLAPAVPASKVDRSRTSSVPRSGPRSVGHSLPPDSGDITEIRTRGLFDAVPRVVVPSGRMRELPIDPRVAFLLSRIDGQSSIETLVDLTGFRPEEVLTLLARLVQLGAIAMGRAAGR
jgi:hypothetical protein